MPSIPTFSLAERDRRWSRTRDVMRRERLDAVLALPNSGHWDQFQSDVRYLTQIGGNATEAAAVFPLEGEVTAILRGANDVAWWGMQQDWVRDMRPSRRLYSLPVAERLREAGLEAGRIGVSGLEGLVRAPEGVVIWGIMERLKEALPKATFVDATEVLQEARAVKSPEEVAFCRKAVGLAEAAVERMLETARPGVPERKVYAAMVETMIAGGGEMPSMILWGAGRQPPWPHRMLTDRVLQTSDLVNNEVEAKWAGYIGQVVAPFSLGPVSPEVREGFAVSVRAFEELRGIMKPGMTFAGVVRRYQDIVGQAGFEPGAMLLHGRGLGEDRPMLSGHQQVEGSLALEEGMVFILKPAAFPRGGREVIERDGEVVELAVRAGDTVVVTATGAERLGSRKMDLIEL